MANGLRPFALPRSCALKTLQWTLTTFKGEGVRFGSGRVVLYPSLDNAASALRPLCVAREIEWCDHVYPGGAGTTP